MLIDVDLKLRKGGKTIELDFERLTEETDRYRYFKIFSPYLPIF